VDEVARYPDGTIDRSCKEAARLICFRRDRELGADEEKELRYHLQACLNCERFGAQIDIIAKLAALYGNGLDASGGVGNIGGAGGAGRDTPRK
jgi:hypothetical protein